MIYLIYSVIFIVILSLFFLINNKIKFIKRIGMIGLVSGIVLLVINITIILFAYLTLNNFNINKIISIISYKFTYNSLILLSIGITCIVISKLLNKSVNREKTMQE